MSALVKIHPKAQSAREAFHSAVISEVSGAVEKEAVVVVGMAWNPFCSKAVNLLTEKGIAHRYLEYGNYLSGWKPRLAIKMWSGWPTFPQVYIGGEFVGGCDIMIAAYQSGELAETLEAALNS